MPSQKVIPPPLTNLRAEALRRASGRTQRA